MSVTLLLDFRDSTSREIEQESEIEEEFSITQHIIRLLRNEKLTKELLGSKSTNKEIYQFSIDCYLL